MNGTIAGSARKGSRRGSFTLIELLVVVTIILILAGITLKVMSLVNRKTGQAQTLWVLEQVKNALGAYYTTYGTYPPVNSVYFEYKGTDPASLPATPTNMYYSTGLVYYIYANPPYTEHNPDVEARRWQHYLERLPGDNGSPPHSNMVGAFFVTWTNNSHTICDAWGTPLQYNCSAPYQKFLLWSCGPNGVNNTGTFDDIGVTPDD